MILLKHNTAFVSIEISYERKEEQFTYFTYQLAHYSYYIFLYLHKNTVIVYAKR